MALPRREGSPGFVRLEAFGLWYNVSHTYRPITTRFDNCEYVRTSLAKVAHHAGRDDDCPACDNHRRLGSSGRVWRVTSRRVSAYLLDFAQRWYDCPRAHTSGRCGLSRPVDQDDQSQSPTIKLS